MVYKQLKKGLRGLSIRPREVSISRTIISFGVDVSEDMLKKGAVEVWFDKDTNSVGFKPSKDSVTGFITKLKNKSGGTRITSKGACNRLPRGIYEATKEDDMWGYTSF